jgi:hypothetical protein
MSDPPPEWSLKHEIKKRKTQEVLRAVEARQVQTPRPLKLPETTAQVPTRQEPQIKPKRITQTLPEGKRTTQIAGVVSYSTGWTKRQRQTGIIATILVIAACLLTTLVATSQPILHPTLSPLPIESTGNLVGYLRDVGVPVANLRTLSVPSAMWNAKEEIQFDVLRWDGKGVFVILSYDSPAQAGIDAFKATYHQKFKTWNLMQISNVLVLTSPDTGQPLSAEIASHLTQYLVAPYRSFIPSTTPGKAR